MPSEPLRWVVEPFGRHHDSTVFSCGNEVLDHYLKHVARQDARRRVAAPFVLVEKTASKTTIVGYYTLSSYGIDLTDCPQQLARKLPRYPIVPATLLGRLAVDQRYQRRGVGEFLIVDALHRALVQSAQIASVAVIVDAMDDAAIRFYRHFEFVPFPDKPRRLFLSMKTIETLFAES
jgi:GNAT superfamily N-acetyltransferase